MYIYMYIYIYVYIYIINKHDKTRFRSVWDMSHESRVTGTLCLKKQRQGQRPHSANQSGTVRQVSFRNNSFIFLHILSILWRVIEINPWGSCRNSEHFFVEFMSTELNAFFLQWFANLVVSVTISISTSQVVFDSTERGKFHDIET